MCGIAGYMRLGGGDTPGDSALILGRMADAIRARGPDSAGLWHDDVVGVGLAHRRLSIVDLSPAGHQPMVSCSGRYVLVFNGEIYNHQGMRAELARARQSVRWRGHSDTETLLAGFDVWGIEPTVRRATGMFAFAVWDRQERELTLARDRIGEKPLYYGWRGSGAQAHFLFGSELKALRAYPGFRGEVDRDALCLLLRHNYIPAPYSIYQGIQKLPPGSMLTVSPGIRGEPRSYWSLSDVARAGQDAPFEGGDTEAVDALESLLRTVVGQQMVSDVPLGAFLSGGIDSSTVVAMMQVQSPRPVRTFTIGFDEPGYNEAEHAKVIAAHLGTDHTELYVTAREAMAVIPSLPMLYDEPFADSSQIPTFLVSQLARQHVTVSLSGDAGDELFCGYTRYLAAAGAWARLRRIPVPVRRWTAERLLSMRPETWDRLARVIPGLTARMGERFGDRLHKAANVLGSGSIDALYRGLVSHWGDPAEIVLGGTEPVTWLTGMDHGLEALGDVERMMALDMVSYLPDDILAKVDRAAMGVSLETRVPFLDHRLIEFAWCLPQRLKLRAGQGKWVLRQVLYRHVPRAVMERPKMGFGVPLDVWLRGPLREWAESLLSHERLSRDGYFNPAPIRMKWDEHLSGRRNWAYHLWDVLMFQAWLAEQ